MNKLDSGTQWSLLFTFLFTLGFITMMILFIKLTSILFNAAPSDGPTTLLLTQPTRGLLNADLGKDARITVVKTSDSLLKLLAARRTAPGTSDMAGTAAGFTIPRNSPIIVLTDDATAAYLASKNLVSTPPWPSTTVKPSESASAGVILWDDPIVLEANAKKVADAGLSITPENTATWDNVQRLSMKLGLVACDDIFSSLLYQYRGRLADSYGKPVFQFERGQTALVHLRRLFGYSLTKQRQQAIYSARAVHSFASGEVALLLGKRSVTANRSMQFDCIELPHPQTPNGLPWTGGTRAILSLAYERNQMVDKNVAKKFFTLADELSQRHRADHNGQRMSTHSRQGKTMEPPSVRNERVTPPPPGDLVFYAANKAILSEATTSALCQTTSTKLILRKAAYRCLQR